MVKDIMEDVLRGVTGFRAVQAVNMMLEGVLEDVKEHAMVNAWYNEVLERGCGAMDNLERRASLLSCYWILVHVDHLAEERKPSFFIFHLFLPNDSTIPQFPFLRPVI